MARRIASHSWISSQLYRVFVFLSAVVGGLLSAHLLAGRAGMELEPGWPCSGPLLRMAEDAARKLLPGMKTHLIIEVSVC